MEKVQKHFLVYLTFFLSSSFLFSQVDKAYKSKESQKLFYKNFITKHCSNGIQTIWESDRDGVFAEYVDGTTEKELVASLSTVIHELLHGLNKTSNESHTYYLGENVSIKVPLTKVYNSKELNKYVRKGLQDSIIRYGLYIQGANTLPGLGKIKGINDSKNNEVMSIQLGIYGILEEYLAYYFGCLTAYESYSFYEQNYSKTNPELWSEYVQQVESDELAFYEFQLFTAWYLTYAKNNFPEQYKQFYANKNLRVVFTFIYENYQKLLQDVAKVKVELKQNETEEDQASDILNTLDYSGSDEDLIRFMKMVGLDDDEIFKEVKSNTGTKKVFILDKEEMKMMTDEYENLKSSLKKMNDDFSTENNKFGFYFTEIDTQIIFLKKEMTKELHVELQKFLIPNLTQENYKKYIAGN